MLHLPGTKQQLLSGHADFALDFKGFITVISDYFKVMPIKSDDQNAYGLPICLMTGDTSPFSRALYAS